MDASRLLEVDAEADEVNEADEVGPADTSADEETAELGLTLALALVLMLELDSTALANELAAEGTNTT